MYRSAIRYKATKLIIGFRHKGLELYYRSGSTRGINSAHAAKLTRILTQLEFATAPIDIQIPNFRLHPLKGSSHGFWSVWVNGNWRVTFCFIGTNIELVDYLDYH